jgi:hypothetical protein
MNIKTSVAVASFLRGRAKDLSAPLHLGATWFLLYILSNHIGALILHIFCLVFLRLYIVLIVEQNLFWNSLIIPFQTTFFLLLKRKQDCNLICIENKPF